MASVTFKRTNNIDSVPITDGQLIFDTSDQKIYLDNGNTREVYGGGSGTDLISNVSDATDNNAFNANATVNLFTRKSSIVDTKAEIQSVTQAGVPLGCKGFNEVIGTGDISALGDGSVTGAILANKSAIDTVNQNLTKTLIYNPQDDYFYLNGVKTIYRGYQNAIVLFKDGIFGEPMYNSPNTIDQAYFNTVGAWSVVNNTIRVGNVTSGVSYTYLTERKIDLTNYSSIKAIVNGTTITLNVSAFQGAYYVGLGTYIGADSKTRTRIALYNADQANLDLNGNRPAIADAVFGTVRAMACTEIIIE